MIMEKNILTIVQAIAAKKNLPCKRNKYTNKPNMPNPNKHLITWVGSCPCYWTWKTTQVGLPSFWFNPVSLILPDLKLFIFCTWLQIVAIFGNEHRLQNVIEGGVKINRSLPTLLWHIKWLLWLETKIWRQRIQTAYDTQDNRHKQK